MFMLGIQRIWYGSQQGTFITGCLIAMWLLQDDTQHCSLHLVEYLRRKWGHTTCYSLLIFICTLKSCILHCLITLFRPPLLICPMSYGHATDLVYQDLLSFSTLWSQRHYSGLWGPPLSLPHFLWPCFLLLEC